MDKLFELERIKIISPLYDLIEKSLAGEFKTRDDYSLDKVDNISIRDVAIDEGNSDLRNKIVITGLVATARVWVMKNENLKTNRSLELSVSNSIEIIFNDDLKQYLVQNMENFKVIDITQF